jgi:hypothetical protein
VKIVFHFQSIWPKVVDTVSFIHMVEFICVLKLIIVAWCSTSRSNFIHVEFFQCYMNFIHLKILYMSLVLSNYKKIIQMWISSLSFNIWYHPNLKLMEMHCLIIQPWYIITYEFNICSLGQFHRANFLFPLYVFCAFHNCWGLSFKYFKTNKGSYMEEKYEDFHFIS